MFKDKQAAIAWGIVCVTSLCSSLLLVFLYRDSNVPILALDCIFMVIAIYSWVKFYSNYMRDSKERNTKSINPAVNKKVVKNWGITLLKIAIVALIGFGIVGMFQDCSSPSKCKVCHGSGYYNKKTCFACGGSGYSDYDPYKEYNELMGG